MIRSFFNLSRRLLIKTVGRLRSENSSGLGKELKYNTDRILMVTIGIAGFTVCAACEGLSSLTVANVFKNLRDDVEFMGPPITDIKKLSEMENDPKAKMELLALRLQAVICNSLNSIEREHKLSFTVKRSNEKGSLLCYQEEEEIFEKISVEVINKESHPSSRIIGICTSIYPKNPNIPSLQLNLLYTEENGSSEFDSSVKPVKGSFSGRLLLVPYVYNEKVFKNYHKTLKEVCNKYCMNCYTKFKALCDESSQVQGKAIGIGGISFPADGTRDVSLDFLKSLVFAIIPLYMQLVVDQKDEPYTYNDRMWQLETRSRQILDFMTSRDKNLIDPESCLVHLPPMTKWCIISPLPGDKQESLLPLLEKPITWA